MSQPLTLNVTAGYEHEGMTYVVRFREVLGDLLFKTGMALRLLKEEHGIDADPNDIILQVAL